MADRASGAAAGDHGAGEAGRGGPRCASTSGSTGCSPDAPTAGQLERFERAAGGAGGARAGRELDQLRGGTANISGRGSCRARLSGRSRSRRWAPAGRGCRTCRRRRSPRSPAMGCRRRRRRCASSARARRAATLLATVRQLEVDSVDDALDLFDLLMATKLLARAERLERQGEAEVAAGTAPRGGEDRQGGRGAVGDPAGRAASRWSRWRRRGSEIERAVPRDELTVALEQLDKLVPDDGDGDNDAEWRAELVKRYGSVTGFLGLLARLELGAVDVAPAGVWPRSGACRRSSAAGGYSPTSWTRRW